MKLKERCAEEDPTVLIYENPVFAIFNKDAEKFIHPLCKAAFIAGFEKALALAASQLEEDAKWAFEGWNQGEQTLRECQREERLLLRHAREIRKIGNRTSTGTADE